MKRPLAALFLVVLIVAGALVARRGGPAPTPAPPDAHNPGGYVASDVGLLAATGRPQLVEVFHYG